MNRQDREQFEELKQLIASIHQAKFDPDNGWKTARAVFETNTVNALDNINKSLENISEVTAKIPALITTVESNVAWRKRMNKVLIWIGMGIGLPILAGLGTLIWKLIIN